MQILSSFLFCWMLGDAVDSLTSSSVYKIFVLELPFNLWFFMNTDLRLTAGCTLSATTVFQFSSMEPFGHTSKPFPWPQLLHVPLFLYLFSIFEISSSYNELLRFTNEPASKRISSDSIQSLLTCVKSAQVTTFLQAIQFMCSLVLEGYHFLCYLT